MCVNGLEEEEGGFDYNSYLKYIGFDNNIIVIFEINGIYF